MLFLVIKFFFKLYVCLIFKILFREKNVVFFKSFCLLLFGIGMLVLLGIVLWGFNYVWIL